MRRSMHRDKAIILLLAGAAIVGGCRREREHPAPPIVKEPPPPIAVEQSTPPPEMMPPTMAPASMAPAPQPTAPEVPKAPRLVSNADLPFAICAVTEERNGAIKVGVVDKESGASGLLRVGQTFGGYELVSYDDEREIGVFKYGGEQIMVGFSSGPASDAGSLPAENLIPAEPIPMGAPPLDRIDLRGIDQNNMKPTAKEKELGIDPHDPATWPKGYRGPVIERLLQRQKDAGIEPEESPIPLAPAQRP